MTVTRVSRTKRSSDYIGNRTFTSSLEHRINLHECVLNRIKIAWARSRVLVSGTFQQQNLNGYHSFMFP